MKTHSQPSRILQPKAAFTLTELLVTIVIIIIIAALSLSGISRMRQSGDRIGATRSLAQIQLANAGYAADNNGQYVPVYANDQDTGKTYVGWMNNPKFLAFQKGEASVYKANGSVDNTLPLNMLDPITVRAKKLNYKSIVASFGYMTSGMPGQGWGVPAAAPSFRISQLTSPERTGAFITGTDWNVSYAHRFLWQGAAAVEGFTPDQKLAYRHNGKALVVYYDGHVGEISMADVKKIDSTGGGNANIFWKGDAK